MKIASIPTPWRQKLLDQRAGEIAARANEREAEASRRMRLRDVFPILQSIAVTLSIVAAGLWALTRFSLLLEARIATAQAERAEADLATARRNALAYPVVNVELTATQLPGAKRHVMVELSLKNTGNVSTDISLMSNARFYLARLTNVEADGVQTYNDIVKLKFDYPDKTLTWFHLQPGAEITKYRTVQQVMSPGTYLVRFSARATSKDLPQDSEYSAQSFFSVK